MQLESSYDQKLSAAVVHGSGYVGRELIKLLTGHPTLRLETVVSGSAAGQPVHSVHPTLRGVCSHDFVSVEDAGLADHDVVFVAGVPGTGVAAYNHLTEAGFDGVFVDMSTDFRFTDPAEHLRWNGAQRPEVAVPGSFVYGLPEIVGPYPPGTKRIANPGCFATGLALAIWPLASNLSEGAVHVTALTGASGSGGSPSKTTHFPDRDGNVRAYKVFAHRHLGEVLQTVGNSLDIAFVPVSGPWTRGIWGTAQLQVAESVTSSTVNDWFESAYGGKSFVRLYGEQLPELHYSVDSPFCDLGWKLSNGHLVVGFALDNLMKGAASQAIQNANLALGLPEASGLLPDHSRAVASVADNWS